METRPPLQAVGQRGSTRSLGHELSKRKPPLLRRAQALRPPWALQVEGHRLKPPLDREDPHLQHLWCRGLPQRSLGQLHPGRRADQGPPRAEPPSSQLQGQGAGTGFFISSRPRSRAQVQVRLHGCQPPKHPPIPRAHQLPGWLAPSPGAREPKDNALALVPALAPRPPEPFGWGTAHAP